MFSVKMFAAGKQKKKVESGSLGAYHRLIILKDGRYRADGRAGRRHLVPRDVCVRVMWIGWNLRGWLGNSHSDDDACLSTLSVRQGHHRRNK